MVNLKTEQIDVDTFSLYDLVSVSVSVFVFVFLACASGFSPAGAIGSAEGRR